MGVCREMCRAVLKYVAATGSSDREERTVLLYCRQLSTSVDSSAIFVGTLSTNVDTCQHSDCDLKIYRSPYNKTKV